MKLTIGLTGGIGSGKSSVGELFAAHGVAVVDADAIAHQLTQPGGATMPRIRAAFGAAFVNASGALDRARMRSLVFTDRAAKQRLESILHPLIRAEGERRAAAAAGPYVVMMIPLLVESGGARERFGRVLVVDCSEEEQLRRVMARSGLAHAEVTAIIAAQATRAARLAAADDVIDNSGSPDALPPQVARLHEGYLQLVQGTAAKRS